MTETILQYDEEESRRSTEAAMQQTAARFGFGNNMGSGAPPPPTAYVPASPRTFVPEPYQSPQVMQPPLLVANVTTADHLLITPAGRPGLVRLIHMQGAEKRDSWSLAEGVMPTVIAVLRSFGIQLTDLREEDDDA